MSDTFCDFESNICCDLGNVLESTTTSPVVLLLVSVSCFQCKLSEWLLMSCPTSVTLAGVGNFNDLGLLCSFLDNLFPSAFPRFPSFPFLS